MSTFLLSALASLGSSASCLLAHARSCLENGEGAIEVHVVRTEGSVPRESGARMLVSKTQVSGTIGGGHLEYEAAAQALRYLEDPSFDQANVQRYALGPSLGQCCGGVVYLTFAKLTAHSLATWAPSEARVHVQLHGGGHVGLAVARLFSVLPCQVQWIDERDGHLPPDALARHIECCVSDDAPSEVARAPAGACYLVLTHSHELDQRLTEAILRRNDRAFFGLIGSATKRAQFEARLRRKGFDEATIATMVCPIGDGSHLGKEPEVIALGAVAQLWRHAKAMPPR